MNDKINTGLKGEFFCRDWLISNQFKKPFLKFLYLINGLILKLIID